MNHSNKTTMPGSCDVIVVGARCAGASTAMLLARQGLKVLVIDRGQYGTDTLSTHSLVRGGVLQLHRWGLLGRLVATGTPPIRMTSFHYGDHVEEVQIKARGGVDALYSPRRTVLDALLADAARESGVEMAYGVQLIDLPRNEDGRVCGAVVRRADQSTVRIRSEMVIGADGLRSTVARMVGSRPYRVGRHSSGTIFAYWSGLEIHDNHWYYRPGVSAGVIPTNDGLACIFVSVRSDRFRAEIAPDVPSGYRRLLTESDSALAERVMGGQRIGNFRGFAGELGFLRSCWGPGWALVGDSGYFRDPLTAHGITDAFRDAELLSGAVGRGTPAALAEYAALRDEFSTGLFEASDEIASFEWDLPTVQEKHLFMSREMNREANFLEGLQPKDIGRKVAEPALVARGA